jgi:Amt family ammonium transporter
LPVPELSPLAIPFCLIAIFLVPLASAGLSLINTGLGRSRSAAHTLLASICVIGVSAIVYFVCGFAWEGFAGRPAHVIIAGHKAWNWIAAEPFFLRGVAFDGSPAGMAALFQVLTVGLAAMIPLGSGADRWRLTASCISAALLAGVTYPLFAHWVWGGGWLAQLGVNYNLGRGFIDAGGASTIQAVGGLTALSITWILGPRRGKYAPGGMPAAIPGHNAVLVLFACLLALVGWFGLNAAGAMLFSGADLTAVPLIGINTVLSAGAGVLATAVMTSVRFGKPDASLCANGWVGGLVAGSAGCAFMAPAAAVLTGLVAGIVIPVFIEWFELRLWVDDPGGAVSVHAISGIWGVIATGIFARNAGHEYQWLAQLIGAATLIGFVLPLTYGLNWLLDRVYRQRVAVEGEQQGMDLYELGAGAYPEFFTNEEYQR